MRILAVDTCGPVIGVAVRANGDTRMRTERISRGAETLLVPWALELCREFGFSLGELDGVAGAGGPGAFTGIRVGLAAATGWAMAIKCPFWVGSSLRSRALRATGGDVLVLLDAKKSRVYAEYWRDASLCRGPADLSPGDAIAWTKPGFIATGEGALVYVDAVQAAGGRVHAEADHPAVDCLALLAEQAFQRGENMDPLHVAPVYLRDADATPPVRG